MNYVLHCFMPGHTIEAVIRLKNGYHLSKEELDLLKAEFNRLNGADLVRPGMTKKIPLLSVTDSEGGHPD